MKMDPELIERRRKGHETARIVLTFSSPEKASNFEMDGFTVLDQKLLNKEGLSSLTGQFALAHLDELTASDLYTSVSIDYEVSTLPVGEPIPFDEA